MIEIKHLYKSFEDKEVLHDISTVFEDGKTNLIIGQSGSGKTVLMKNLVGLLDPTSGQVLYDGRDFVAMTKREKIMLRREMGMIFQSAALFDSLSVLENVMNPTNLGAIFRSAAALGVDAVLLTEAGSDPLYRRAVRVSMGTVFQVPWTYLPEGDWQELLHGLGFQTAAMALRDDSLSIADPCLPGIEKLAVVLGTEGDGLASDTIARCDYTVRIPMRHGVDSLNVAAASAVAFYQLCLRAEG